MTYTRRFSALLGLVLCVQPAPSQAQRLPVTSCTIAQGLASNTVYKIVPDSRGFIWFATRDGLSRFDGYAFTKLRDR